MTFSMPCLHRLGDPLPSGARIGRHGLVSLGSGERSIGTAVTTSSTFGGEVLVMRGILVLTTANLYVVFDEAPAVYTRNGKPTGALVGHKKISGIVSPIKRFNATRTASENVFASVIDLADVRFVEEVQSQRNGYNLRLESASAGGAAISLGLDGDADARRQFSKEVLKAVAERNQAGIPDPKHSTYTSPKGRHRSSTTTWPIEPRSPSSSASATSFPAPTSPPAPPGRAFTPPLYRAPRPEVQATVAPIRREAASLSRVTREAVERFVVQVAPTRIGSAYVFAAEPDALIAISDGVLFVSTAIELLKCQDRLHIRHGLSAGGEIKWVEINGRRYGGLSPSNRIEPFLKYTRSSPVQLLPDPVPDSSLLVPPTQ